MYILALNTKVEAEIDNPTIRIIVCQKKNRIVVEYLLKDINQPIGVATYNHYDELNKIPEAISKYLPSQEEIAKRLGEL